MSDKLDTVNLKDYLLAANERDALRAENERLREENDGLIEITTKPGGLYEEIERLRAALHEHHPLLAEELFCHICSKLD